MPIATLGDNEFRLARTIMRPLRWLDRRLKLKNAILSYVVI